MKRALSLLAFAALALPAHADAGGIESTVFLAAIFALACFVGYYGLGSEGWIAKILGAVAVMLASVNIFGGFLVTQRMLAMYKKKGQ